MNVRQRCWFEKELGARENAVRRFPQYVIYFAGNERRLAAEFRLWCRQRKLCRSQISYDFCVQSVDFETPGSVNEMEFRLRWVSN